MNRHHRAVATATIVLLAASLFSGCYNGASRRAAVERQMAGDNEGALWAAREALLLNPRDVQARQVLEAAASAYGGEALETARRSQGGAQALAQTAKAAWTLRLVGREQQIQEASRLADQLEGQAGDLQRGEAKRFFEMAESSFGSRDWEKARDGYRQALFHDPAMKQAEEQLGLTYVNIGQDLFGKKLYRAASENFAQAVKYRPTDASAKGRQVACHVELAEFYRTNKHYRLELKELETLRSLDPTRQNLRQQLETAREKATTRLAVLPIKPQVGVPWQAGNINVSELSQDKIGAKLNNNKSEFIRMLDRRHTEELMEEIYFSASDFAKPGMQIPAEAFDVCDVIVTGRLTEMNVSGPFEESNVVESSAPTSLFRDEYFTDQQGVQRVRTVVYGQANIPYRYTEVRRSIDVALAGSVLALEVETSRELVEKQFSPADGDAVHFAVDLQVGYIPPDARTSERVFIATKVPHEVKQLLEAPREIRPPEMILQELVDTASTEWARSILDAIDGPPPAWLNEPFGQRR